MAKNPLNQENMDFDVDITGNSLSKAFFFFIASIFTNNFGDYRFEKCLFWKKTFDLQEGNFAQKSEMNLFAKSMLLKEIYLNRFSIR